LKFFRLFLYFYIPQAGKHSQPWDQNVKTRQGIDLQFVKKSGTCRGEQMNGQTDLWHSIHAAGHRKKQHKRGIFFA
jgi:hypothetical protein